MAVLTEHTLACVLRAGGGQSDKARAEQLARRAEDRAGRIGMVLPAPPFWLVAGKLTSPGRSREASLRSCPGGFRIAVDGRATLLPDRVGFSYLVELIVRPGRDLEVLSLASDGLLRASRSDALADEPALSSYRRRVRELKTLLGRDDLEASVSDRYGQELATLTTVLRSSVGLGGRARTFPDDNERGRTAVRKALVRAVTAIEAVEPDLGLHLRTSLVTGVTCRYSPAPGWNVTADARDNDRIDL